MIHKFLLIRNVVVANIQGNSVVDTLFCNDLQLNDLQYVIPGAKIMWSFPQREKSTWWVTLNTTQQVQFYGCLVA